MGATLKGSLQILHLLNSAPSRQMSVPELCSNLACTKEELHARIEALNAFDYLIFKTAANTLQLGRDIDFYDEACIYRQAKGKGRVSVLECIGSTNTEMLMKPSSLASGDVILAEIQSGGRSRRNTKWYAPLGSQLTMSICATYSPQINLAGLSVAVGMQIASVLSDLGFAGIQVKWPNDLYVEGRKLCGILVESITNQHGIYVVTGVGLNVHREGYEELETPYITLDDCGPALSRNEVAIALIGSLRTMFEQFSLQGFTLFQPEFAVWDYLQGRNIAVQTEEQRYQGKACGVDEKGALLLQTPIGVVHLSSGHIL